MIDADKITQFEEAFTALENQFGLLLEKIKESDSIESDHRAPEEEKSRLLSRVETCRKEVLSIPVIIKSYPEKFKPDDKIFQERLETLLKIDGWIQKTKNEIAAMAEEQYATKLDLYKQEIFKSLETVAGLINFIFPNIQHEIEFLENHYGRVDNVAVSIMPELEKLLAKFREYEISFHEFLFGYEGDEGNVSGYNQLRTENKLFSRYQFYENHTEDYRLISQCLKEIGAAIHPLLIEKRHEPDIEALIPSLTMDEYARISRANDIFYFNTLLGSMIKVVGRKYSYRKEYKKAKELFDDFGRSQKLLIFYNLVEFNRMREALEARLANEKDKIDELLNELKKHMDEKTIAFRRIDFVVEKISKGDFNVAVLEKDADDITLHITPHLEKSYGRNILERINIVVQEINFWYPHETRQILFQQIGQFTNKVQLDQPVDKKAFLGLMKNCDKEIEENQRKSYPERVKLAAQILANFQNTISEKVTRDKLEKRLRNPEIWKEITPRLEAAKKNLTVLNSGHASLAENVNKFIFLKGALDELCQLFYDLAMQLFVGYEKKDAVSVVNMTNILSVYNEFHDVKSCSAAFMHYLNKIIIPNFHVNEKLMTALSRDSRCRARLEKLFPEKK